MTNFFARRRRSAGAQVDALLSDHAHRSDRPDEVEAELRSFVGVALANPTSAALLVADMPAPARGYAAMMSIDGQAVAYVHLLDGQPTAVARALFSQMSVQAKLISGNPGVKVYAEGLSAHTRQMIETEGGPYGVRLSSGSPETPAPEPDPVPDTTPEPTEQEFPLYVADEAAGQEEEFEEVEPLPVPGDDAPTDEEIVAELSSLTIAELRSIADERGVRIPKDTKKADIIAMLVTDARG